MQRVFKILGVGTPILSEGEHGGVIVPDNSETETIGIATRGEQVAIGDRAHSVEIRRNGAGQQTTSETSNSCDGRVRIATASPVG